jgi:hypothetical protein
MPQVCKGADKEFDGYGRKDRRAAVAKERSAPRAHARARFGRLH